MVQGRPGRSSHEETMPEMACAEGKKSITPGYCVQVHTSFQCMYGYVEFRWGGLCPSGRSSVSSRESMPVVGRGKKDHDAQATLFSGRWGGRGGRGQVASPPPPCFLTGCSALYTAVGSTQIVRHAVADSGAAYTLPCTNGSSCSME